MTVRPTQVTAGATVDSLAFTYTADSRALRGLTRLVVPPGWTKPQSASPSSPGYIRIGRGGCGAATRLDAIRDRAVTIRTACARGRGFRVTYSGVTGAVIAAGYTFLAETKPAAGTRKTPPRWLPLGPARQPIVAVVGGMAQSFQVTTTSLIVAGTSFRITARAVDAYGNTARDARGDFYMSTLSFTSSDATATLPAPYTLTPADFAAHTFRGLVLNTPGDQTIRVSDENGVTGESSPITVTPY